MPDGTRRNDVFTAISIVTCVFMLAGLGIAAYVWRSYVKEFRPQSNVPLNTRGPDLTKESTEEPVTPPEEIAPPAEKNPDGTEPKAPEPKAPEPKAPEPKAPNADENPPAPGEPGANPPPAEPGVNNNP